MIKPQGRKAVLSADLLAIVEASLRSRLCLGLGISSFDRPNWLTVSILIRDNTIIVYGIEELVISTNRITATIPGVTGEPRPR
jgi:hypothetical protein